VWVHAIDNGRLCICIRGRFAYGVYEFWVFGILGAFSFGFKTNIVSRTTRQKRWYLERSFSELAKDQPLLCIGIFTIRMLKKL